MVIAKQINKLTGRKGRVFKERYHARVLRSPTEVMLSRRYILNNFRKHLAQRLATERTQPQAAHICVTPKHLDIARQILAAPAGSIHIRRRAAWQPGALRCPTGPSNCSGGPGSNALAQAKGPRRAATKAAREPDRSVVVLREDRQAERQRTWPRWIGPSTSWQRLLCARGCAADRQRARSKRQLAPYKASVQPLGLLRACPQAATATVVSDGHGCHWHSVGVT